MSQGYFIVYTLHDVDLKFLWLIYVQQSHKKH